MATFHARRSITYGWVPALILAALGTMFFVGTYVYERFHPASHVAFVAPSPEQVSEKTERDARYLHLYAEKNRLEVRIQSVRPKLDARKNAIHAEEASLLDVQAHLADERRDIPLASLTVRAAFDDEVREFNRRRTALMARDDALVRDVDELNDDIRRRNQLVQAMNAMDNHR